MINRDAKDVLLRLTNQFPEFANTIKELTNEYKETIKDLISSANESQKQTLDEYKQILNTLRKQVEQPNIPFEEKKYYLEQIKEIHDKIYKKDTEHKMLILGLAITAGATLVKLGATLVNAIGGNAQIENNDVPDLQIDDLNNIDNQ